MQRHALLQLFLALVISLMGLTNSAAQTQPKLEYITYKGTHYATARSIKAFYKFSSMVPSGSYLILRNQHIEMKLSVAGQNVWINGIKFVFSFPITRSKGRYLVSATDLKKLIDPILRPAYIDKNRSLRTIILDPGHGGKDPGTSNSRGTEKAYALKLAHKVKRELQKRGFKNVVMTRSTDTFLSLSQRVAFANHYDDAVFISLHFNAVGRGASRASGIETFTLSPVGVAHYGRGTKASDFQSKTGNAQDTANIALATAIHSTIIKKTKRPDRGIRRARFSVLSGIKHPAILFEGGFMSHPTESKLIANDSYHDVLARGIADSLIKYNVALNKRAK